MEQLLLVILIVVIGPVVYLLREIARDLRVMSERLRRAEFEFNEPNPPQIKSNGKRQLKG